MEELLKQDFTNHYKLPVCTNQIYLRKTNAPYFELNDDTTLIYTSLNSGIAKVKNTKGKEIIVINYEEFIGLLPSPFKQGREVCDLIAYSEDKNYFLLNELTNTLPKYVTQYTNSKGIQIGKQAKAKKQLFSSLTDLTNVVSIKNEINRYSIKRCCFFNKQSIAPTGITASNAFNRINTISSNGFKMSNALIESLGFEYFEYSGNQKLEIQ